MPCPLPCALLSSLLAPLAALLLAFAAAAQAPDAKVRAPDLRLYTLGQEVKELATTLDAVEKSANETPDRDRKLELVAWRALALDANGANMRYGPRKTTLKRLVSWLRMSMQPGHHLRTVDADTPRELHLLAVFVVARAQTEANYRLLQRALEQGWVDVRAKFHSEGAAPVTAREAALLVMFAHTMQLSQRRQFQEQALQFASDGIAAIPEGRDKLADAVRHQLDRIRGEKHPEDLTLALSWPGDIVREPFQAAFAAFVTRTLTPEAHAQKWQEIEPWISIRSTDGMWDAPAKQDRDVTTAMVLATLGMCHEPEQPEQPEQQDGGKQ